MLIPQFFGHQYLSISLLNLHWYTVFVDGGNSSSFSSYLHLVSLGVASLLLFLFFAALVWVLLTEFLFIRQRLRKKRAAWLCISCEDSWSCSDPSILLRAPPPPIPPGVLLCMSGLSSRGGLASGSWRLKLTADWSGWWLDIDLPSCHLQPSPSSVMDTQWGLTSPHGLTAEHVSEQSSLCSRRQLQKTEQGKVAYGNLYVI